MRNRKWLWPTAVIGVATVCWFTGNRGFAGYGWVMGGRSEDWLSGGSPSSRPQKFFRK